ncbi:MAG: hypothetical protein RIF39_03210, partial [Cyclobacteriaceae bacterium]
NFLLDRMIPFNKPHGFHVVEIGDYHLKTCIPYRKGINPPEYLGEQEDHYQFMLQYLKDRGVNYNVETQQKMG